MMENYVYHFDTKGNHRVIFSHIVLTTYDITLLLGEIMIYDRFMGNVVQTVYRLPLSLCVLDSFSY